MTRSRTVAHLELEWTRLAGPWRQRRKLAEVIQRALPILIACHGKLSPGAYVIAVALTDNRHQKALNHQFRGINKTTNVLSFPQFTPRALRHIKPGKDPVYLGDISLAYQYIVSESHNNHKILINHMIHLVIHGILHILGYDHQTARQAAVMETLERKILNAMNIANPYAAPPTARQRPRSHSARPRKQAKKQ